MRDSCREFRSVGQRVALALPALPVFSGPYSTQALAEPVAPLRFVLVFPLDLLVVNQFHFEDQRGPAGNGAAVPVAVA
jgi:hypothetical protein